MRNIKKVSEIRESKYIVDADSFNKIKNSVDDDDIVQVVDETESDEIDDDSLNESKKAIISKNDFVKFIKTNGKKKQ